MKQMSFKPELKNCQWSAF